MQASHGSRVPVTSALDIPVLVLNRLWQPVNMCSGRRAVTLLFLGHAEAVCTDENQNFYTCDVEAWTRLTETGRLSGATIASVSMRLSIPSIIVLSIYDRLPKKQVKFTRENIYRRDAFTCQYCGRPFESDGLNLDHVVPRHKGGRSTWENVVTSCIPCNTRKGNKLPVEARMFPLKHPKAPSWRPLFSSAMRPHVDPAWGRFLDYKEAEVEMSA